MLLCTYRQGTSGTGSCRSLVKCFPHLRVPLNICATTVYCSVLNHCFTSDSCCRTESSVVNRSNGFKDKRGRRAGDWGCRGSRALDGSSADASPAVAGAVMRVLASLASRTCCVPMRQLPPWPLYKVAVSVLSGLHATINRIGPPEMSERSCSAVLAFQLVVVPQLCSTTHPATSPQLHSEVR